jgi:hypothetical protein
MQSYTSETECSRRGAVLGMVLVIVVLVSLLGAGMMTHSRSIAVEAAKAVSQSQAFWTAEAGLQRLLAIARDAVEPLEDQGLHGTAILGGSTAKGTYSVDVYDAAGWVNALHQVKRYRIVSTGTSTGGRVSVVEVETELSTFGSYVMSSNIGVTPADQPIYFGDGDTIMGPVYANDVFNVWHDPIFLFPSPEGDDWTMSSAAGYVNYNANDESVFEDGEGTSRLRLNQSPLDFASLTEFFDAQKAQAGKVLPAGDYDMTFNEDGTVVYEKRTGGTGPVTNDLSSFNGVIYVDGNVFVEGVVNGDVALVVEHNIRITDDIEYESARSPNPWTGGFDADAVNDTLLMLSKEYVRIEGDTKPAEDRTVHASIYVTEDNTVGNPGTEWYGFCAEYYRDNIGKPKLNLFGGVVQYRRGLVARPPNTPMGTGPSPKGYNKNFRYDVRMANGAWPYSGYFVRRWSYQ